MSFVTGTQCELLYAMPASGVAVTAAAITVLSGTTNANPAYQLPANFFSQVSGSGPGKSLLIKGGGFYTVGTTAVTDVITVGLNSTRGTLGTTLAKSGAWTTVISQSNVEFEFEVFVTLTVPGQGGGNNASVNSMGHLLVGQAGDAANPTLQTVGPQWATPIMIGAAQTAKTFDPTVGQYVEVHNTWSATTGAPTATLTNFYVFGLN